MAKASNNRAIHLMAALSLNVFNFSVITFEIFTIKTAKIRYFWQKKKV